VRPGTPDDAPLIGRAQNDGMFLAAGHYRNGILLAPLTASWIACAIAGESLPPLASAFSPGRSMTATA
jgi:glycine oxidase